MAWQSPQPIIVQIIPEPAHQTTLGDVFLSSIALTVVAVIAAAVLGVLLAGVLIQWHRRRPPSDDRMPSISPLIAESSRPPSGPVR